MLQQSTVLRDKILNLPMARTVQEGITNLVNVIGDYMDQVQGGSLGQVGIFKLNRSIMIAQLISLQPVINDSWVIRVVNAWEAGVKTSVIAPSTVTNPVWIGSGGLDTVTLTTGSATILTIPLARSILYAALIQLKPVVESPLPFAEGINRGTKSFVFNCIGLGPPLAFPPIPIPTPAL